MNKTQYVYIYRYPKHKDNVLKIGTSTSNDRVGGVNKTFLADKPVLYKLYQFDIEEATFLGKYSRSRTIDDFFKSILKPYLYKGDGGSEFYRNPWRKAEKLVEQYAGFLGGVEVSTSEARIETDSRGITRVKTIYEGLTLPQTFYFETPRAKSVYGEMRLIDGRFRVTKAKFRATSPSVSAIKPEDIEELRKQFDAKGMAEFSSPSRAAAFLYGQNVQGPKYWRTKEGKTLADVIGMPI